MKTAYFASSPSGSPGRDASGTASSQIRVVSLVKSLAGPSELLAP